jgi:hypothetical protein
VRERERGTDGVRVVVVRDATPPAVRIAAFALLAVAACDDTVIAPEDYSSACESNADCVITYFGDVCGACLTNFQPVNVAELERIRADQDAISCAPWADRYHVDCVVPVPPTRPICEQNVCVIPAEGDACTFDDGFCHGS